MDKTLITVFGVFAAMIAGGIAVVEREILGWVIIGLAFLWLIFAYFKWLSKPSNRNDIIAAMNRVAKSASRLLEQHQIASEAKRTSPNVVQTESDNAVKVFEETYDDAVDSLEMLENGSVFDGPIESFITSVNTEIDTNKSQKHTSVQIRRLFRKAVIDTVYQLDTIGRPRWLGGQKHATS